MLPLVYNPRFGAGCEDSVLGRNFDSREDGRVVIRNHEGRRWKSRRLVNQELCAFVVTVVRNEKTCGDRRRGDGVLCMQGFEKLCSLQ